MRPSLYPDHTDLFFLCFFVCLQSEYSYLASGSRDRTVKLWDPLKGVCLHTFAAHENWVRAVLFHPSHKYIISASDDKTVRVLDIKVGDQPYFCVVRLSAFILLSSFRRQYIVTITLQPERNRGFFSASVYSCRKGAVCAPSWTRTRTS